MERSIILFVTVLVMSQQLSCSDIKLVAADRDEYNISFYHVKKFAPVLDLRFLKLNKVAVLHVRVRLYLGCMEH